MSIAQLNIVTSSSSKGIDGGTDEETLDEVPAWDPEAFLISCCIASKGNPGTPETYSSSVEFPPSLLLEPLELVLVSYWYSSMAFSRLSLDDNFLEKIKKPKRREKREYLALRLVKATDARKFLNEALDEECQRMKILEM